MAASIRIIPTALKLPKRGSWHPASAATPACSRPRARASITITPCSAPEHPHDLIINLGAEYSRSIGNTTVVLQGYAVGPAPIGPPVFMHRPSAAENLQAPLSHHYLDATHITPGVIAIGIERSGFKFEAGAFHGQEPDENRLDLDTAALDSYSARLSWADGPWSIQLSGADLKRPERKSPYDATRVTASVSYFKGDADRSMAWMAAFGQNREVFGKLEASR